MPDESKEEAQQRRAKQAEKRRLAALKAEQDKLRRAARKRKSNGGAEDNGKEDKLERTYKKFPPKRPRLSTSPPRKDVSPTPPPRTTKQALGQKESEKEKDDDERKEPANKDEVSQHLEEEKGETRVDSSIASGEDVNKKEEWGTGEEKASQKPSAKEKRAAAAFSSSAGDGRSPVVRKTHSVNYAKKTTEALTPPRPRASAKMKPPFGSPMPPAQNTQRREGRQRNSDMKDPPTSNGAVTARESSLPDPPLTDSVAPAKPVADSAPVIPVASAPVNPVASAPVNPVASAPVNPVASAPVNPVASAPVNPVASAPVNPVASAPVNPVASAPVYPVASAPVNPAPGAFTFPSASDSNKSGLPQIRDFSELYAELERFEKEHDVDDYDDGSDDYDDDSDDEVDEDLRQQALQVIAERRDRERIQQTQQQAAAALRQQEEDAIAARSKRARWMLPLMLMGAMYYITWGNPKGWVEWLIFGISPVPNVQVCFNDSNSKEGALQLDPRCVAQATEDSDQGKSISLIDWKPCPAGATCREGLLLSCPPLHEIYQNWCYLSAETNATIASIQDLLHEWTVQSYCSVSGDGHDSATVNREVGQWTGRPFFQYSRVVDHLGSGYDLRLLFLGNKTNIGKKNKLVSRFVLEQEENNNLLLALHPDIPLKITVSCQVGRVILGMIFLIATVFVFLASAFWTAVQRGAVMYYDAMLQNPVIVGVITVFTSSVTASLYHNYWDRFLHEERCSEIEEALCKVYERLKQQAADSTGGQDAEVSSTWLCQDLAWKLHEMSRQKRQEFVEHIWPCVAHNIAQDDRVIKVVRPGGGVEYWKWTEASTSGDPKLSQFGQ